MAGIIGGLIAQKYGGDTGSAAASLLLGEVGFATSTADLAAKIQEGNVNGEDIADVSSAISSILAGSGYLAGAIDTLMLDLVGGVGILLYFYKNLNDETKADFWKPIFEGYDGLFNIKESLINSVFQEKQQRKSLIELSTKCAISN